MSNIFLNEEQFKDIFSSHIKIETYPKSIESLFFSKRKRQRINFEPYYQRNYVWDTSKATYFIESILLGTEIPPLIFFKEGSQVEVIDGRQRFETIQRFLNGEFALSKKGLIALVDLAKKDIDDLRKDSQQIYQTFLDAKIRIIEFELVNQPPSNPMLIDKLKKEIFARYNTGITPLRRAEVENAIYDSDNVSTFFKRKLKKNPQLSNIISSLFLRQVKSNQSSQIESIMQFIRKSLVLFRFPIKHYAGGRARVELVKKFYEFSYSDHENPIEVYKNFVEKIELIQNIETRIQKISGSILPNRLFWECLLWSINVLEQEEFDFRVIGSDSSLNSLTNLFLENISAFELTDSHYYKPTLYRFSLFANHLSKEFSLNLDSAYVEGNAESMKRITEVKSIESDSRTELEKLETLRITKPDPSRNTMEDIHRNMTRTRFMVRPSYQRSEVINLTKASALIESILLGIMLPAIFIYKRDDGVSEVIDGQQRLLSLLGFIGENYIDENNNWSFSKNNEFKLKNLRILKHLNGMSFSELEEDLQDKLWDFELLVVEIEEKLNPEFNPVDLFIRLNDKPFPIKENSFEMWNSWVDKEVVDAIKDIFQKNKEWFYIKNVNRENVRDRMTNEELLTILAYFDYRQSEGKTISSFLDIYQKGDRINARIKKKRDVTTLLTEVTESANVKANFLNSINNITVFLDKLSTLLNCDRSNSNCLQAELDLLLSTGSIRRSHQRTLQNFYILWSIIDQLSVVQLSQESTQKKIEDIFYFMKNIPDADVENNKGFDSFLYLVTQLLGEPHLL